MLTDVLFDLLRQIGARIKHRDDNPQQFYVWVEIVFDAFHRVQHPSYTFERVVFGLQWHNDCI